MFKHVSRKYYSKCCNKTNSKQIKDRSSVFVDIFIFIIIVLALIPLFAYMMCPYLITVKQVNIEKCVRTEYTEQQKAKLNNAIEDYNNTLAIIKDYIEIEGEIYNKIK